MTTPDRLAERLDEKAMVAVAVDMDKRWFTNRMADARAAIAVYLKALATPVPGAVSNAMVERAWDRLFPGNLTVISITKADLTTALEAAVQSPPIVGVQCDGQLCYYHGCQRLPGCVQDNALSSLAPVEAVATEPVGLHIVFDGPPSHESGRFVEVETPDGKSINAGEWHERLDGLWELRLVHPTGDSGALREALAWQDAATTALLKMKDECDLNVVPAVAIAQRVVKAIRAALSKGEPGK